MVLRNRSVKRATSTDDRRPVASVPTARRKVPNIAVSMRQTLCDSHNVVITPPLGQQLVENSFTFNSPRARTSTMKRESLSPSRANPPELSPIQMAAGTGAEGEREVKVKDKSSKRKSNLNIAFNEEATGEC